MIRDVLKLLSPLVVALILTNSCAGHSRIIRTKEGRRILIDKRNGHRYPVARIKDRWWTTRNAAIGLPGASWFPSPMHNPIGMNGYTYTWALAQQICPEGWRLPTSEELADLFSTYGKVAYAGDLPYFREMFGPYQPDSTYATYQGWLKDQTFHLPIPYAYPASDRADGKEERTLFWSCDSVGNRAYAVYWDNAQKRIYFAAYPQSYFGFCRFVRKEKQDKRKRRKQAHDHSIRKQQEAAAVFLKYQLE